MRAQGAYDHLQFAIKERRVFLSTDEVGGHTAFDFRFLADQVIRVEQEAVQVERDQRKHFPSSLSGPFRTI